MRHVDTDWGCPGTSRRVERTGAAATVRGGRPPVRLRLALARIVANHAQWQAEAATASKAGPHEAVFVLDLVRQWDAAKHEQTPWFGEHSTWTFRDAIRAAARAHGDFLTVKTKFPRFKSRHRDRPRFTVTDGLKLNRDGSAYPLLHPAWGAGAHRVRFEALQRKVPRARSAAPTTQAALVREPQEVVMSQHPQPPSPTQTTERRREPLDLKLFVRRLGPLPPRSGATSGRYRRLAALLEDRPVRVSAPPLTPVCFLDGVQKTAVVSRRDHRDITLAYLAAGGVLDGKILVLEETLAALCSTEDLETVQEACAEMPIVAFPDLFAWTLSLSAADWVDTTRRGLERQAIDRAPAEPGRYVMVDGSLPVDAERNDLVGLVKTVETDWISDITLLPERGGWRSPAFRLPPQRSGERARLAAFVRLRDCTGAHPWDYSLIRVEVYEDSGIAVLERAAARALAERQPPGSRDPRWTTQPAGTLRAEEVLKARIPFVVEYLA